MPQSDKITSEMLIFMKRRTSQTIEEIAAGAGVPLGTAQKIFAGITKVPRQSAADALFNYLWQHAEDSEEGSAEGTVPGPFAVNPAFPADENSEGGGNTDRHLPEGGRTGTEETAHTADSGMPNRGNAIRRSEGYTIDDYRALPDGHRCELIDGILYELDSPSDVHQRISAVLTAAFYTYRKSAEGRGEVFPAPFEVQLDGDDRTLLQPDISVVCSPEKIRNWGIFGAPDLVVEIISPVTARKDRALKTMKYAAAGVREYWLVDPENTVTYVHVFTGDTPPSVYPFDREIPVNIYGGGLKICIL